MVAPLFPSKALVCAQQLLPWQHTGPMQKHRLVESDLHKKTKHDVWAMSSRHR